MNDIGRRQLKQVRDNMYESYVIISRLLEDELHKMDNLMEFNNGETSAAKSIAVCIEKLAKHKEETFELLNEVITMIETR